MIEKIKEYFIENIQLAEEFENILIDFIGDEAITYTIEPVPVEPVIRPYTDGSSLRQYVFQFGSREYYDNGIAQNIENLDFYEKFKNEIETKNKEGVLQDIDGIQSIEYLTDGTIQDVQSGTAKYIIQMRITYTKEV
jgi:phosphoribosylaminoimidazole-succinocarboxamide synthase